MSRRHATCTGERRSTLDYPMIRDVENTVIWLNRVVGVAHVGVDILLGVMPEDYNPCHNCRDPFYGATCMSSVDVTSYYKDVTQFPSGIFINNANLSTCSGKPWCREAPGTVLVHNWANRLSAAIAEIWPAPGYGGARVICDEFGHYAHGNAYSGNIGTIRLPRQTQPETVPYLNGPVTEGGVDVAAGRVEFLLMQGDGFAQSDHGFPVQGFASFGNTRGWFHSGPLYPGWYSLYAYDHAYAPAKVFQGYYDISAPGSNTPIRLEEFQGPEDVTQQDVAQSYGHDSGITSISTGPY